MNKSIIKLQNPIEKHISVLTTYHYYLFFLIFLSSIPINWHLLNLIFLSPPMDYICVDDDMLNGCPCKKPKWNMSVFTKTLQTKFEIYCETTWLISFSQSMLFVGTLLGSLFFGFLSDRNGRLSTFFFSTLILAVCGSVVSFMPTIAPFIFFRFLEGFGLGGSIVTLYVFCIENCSTKYREEITALYHVPINMSHITLAGVSYLLRDCDKFQLAISVPVFLAATLYWLTFESPKWLMDNQKNYKAATVMEKIARFNKSPNETVRKEVEDYEGLKEKSGNMIFLQIFKHKQSTINFLCMSVIYFVSGMGYYGVSQYIGMMSGDIHTNVATSGALLLPGTIASIFLLKILKRRQFLMATYLLSGILIFIEIYIPTEITWVQVGIACLCNCFFFMSFIIVFLYGVELFPTSIRNAVLGVLCVEARLGQVVAPLVNSLSNVATATIFGILALTSAAVCYSLPETKDFALPSSFEDTQTLQRRRRTNASKPSLM